MARFVLLLIAPLAWAEPQKPWVSFEIPQASESSAVQAIEAKGLTAIAWSNALVDVSVFQGTEARPLATLNQTLTPSDPRWDPWLKSLDGTFHPRPGASRVWVEADRRGEAAVALGGHDTPRGPVPPRGVTGWMLVAAALLYLALRLAGQGWPLWKNGLGSWVWFPSTLGIVLVGLLLVWGGPTGPVAGGSASAPVSWARHRWYQEALPFGAAWTDWTGKAWSYPQVERRGGKLVEDKASLPAPDEAWTKAAFDSLDSHQTARIFGIANP